jgi:two-component system, OmpR family, sensor histidine kinase KdpD
VTDISQPKGERLLVCVGPSPSTADLIHSARRMAADLHVKWFAVYVEDPKMLMLPESERNRALDHLRLAEQLGAETIVLAGRNVARQIVDFAGERNITKIIAGKPTRSISRSLLVRSPVDQLVRTRGKMDVYVMAGEPGERGEATYVIRSRRLPFSDYGSGLVFFVLANVACFLMYPHFHLSNLIMVYLLGVMLTATTCGRGPAILVSLLSVLAFDFCFVPPRFSFTVEEAQYIVTFAIMLLVALVISHLATMMRRQAEVARLQERQASAMHALSRQLVTARGVDRILGVAVQHFSEIFDGQTVALLCDEHGKLNVGAGDLSSVLERDIMKEVPIARLAYDTGQLAGWGIQNSPRSDILYVPLQAAHSTLGLLALRPSEPGRFLVREQQALLESLAKQVALAMEMERLAGSGASH